MPERLIQTFQVKGEPSVQAVAALFSNFLAVSQVGTEIQFEFVFIDLNQVANLLQQIRCVPSDATPTVEGKTVAKIVMPAATFVQLRSHFEKIFRVLEGIVPKVPGGENEQRSGTG